MGQSMQFADVRSTGSVLEHDNSRRGTVAPTSAEEMDPSIAAALGQEAPGSDTAFPHGAPPVTESSFFEFLQAADRSSRVVELPPRTSRTRACTLHALQEWEGYVVAIGEEEFEARLMDLTANAQYEEEEATIPLQELSELDIRKIRVGSIFRWVIGYERSLGGTKKRVSQIVFRDLPAVSQSDLRDGKAWARKMFQSLNP